jgi:hypothetical protein
MAFSVAAIMATSVSAANWRNPTYDRKIGAWNVNDFRRVMPAFTNAVGIYPNGIEKDDLDTNDNMLHLILPEDVSYDDIGGLRATFDFGGIDEDALAELPNMGVAIQHSRQTWELHNLHADAEAKVACAPVPTETSALGAAVSCNNQCKFDSNLRADIRFIAPGITATAPNGTVHHTPNEWLRITLTCDWDDFTGTGTPGSARVQLLNKQGGVIQLFVWCDRCNGACACPCPGGCGVRGIGCDCACSDCGEVRCICFCETCQNEPCICPCPVCEKPMKDCECEAVTAAIRYSVLEKFKKWTGKGTVTAKIDADHTTFVNLTLDGKEVKSSNYKVKGGSTIITLSESYLNTLDDGEYTFVANFEDGFANLSLVIDTGDDDDVDSNPKAGVALAIIPTLFAAGAVVVTRRRK